MSHVLSLLTLYEVAREVVPAFAQSFVRDIGRDEVDTRIRGFAQRVMARTRIRLDIQGRERVPDTGVYVYMSNHQSHMDIPVLYAAFPSKTVRMVAKKELFQIPLWNRVLRLAGFIEIDRANRRQAIASLDRAAEALGQGISMYIAPEGSRSASGRLGRLKKGGFHLAKNTATAIVPVALVGTLEILPPGKTSMAHDRPVRVVFGAPIPVEGRSVDELMGQVEAFLKANNGRG